LRDFSRQKNCFLTRKLIKSMFMQTISKTNLFFV
jgi:hypothetical protein